MGRFRRLPADSPLGHPAEAHAFHHNPQIAYVVAGPQSRYDDADPGPVGLTR